MTLHQIELLLPVGLIYCNIRSDFRARWKRFAAVQVEIGQFGLVAASMRRRLKRPIGPDTASFAPPAATLQIEKSLNFSDSGAVMKRLNWTQTIYAPSSSSDNRQAWLGSSRHRRRRSLSPERIAVTRSAMRVPRVKGDAAAAAVARRPTRFQNCQSRNQLARREVVSWEEEEGCVWGWGGLIFSFFPNQILSCWDKNLWGFHLGSVVAAGCFLLYLWRN